MNKQEQFKRKIVGMYICHCWGTEQGKGRTISLQETAQEICDDLDNGDTHRQRLTEFIREIA